VVGEKREKQVHLELFLSMDNYWSKDDSFVVLIHSSLLVHW